MINVMKEKEVVLKQEKQVDAKVFGMRMQIALKLKNMTLTALAKELGVTQATVSRWISGNRKPDIYEFKKISEITGKEMEWFFKPID